MAYPLNRIPKAALKIQAFLRLFYVILLGSEQLPIIQEYASAVICRVCHKLEIEHKNLKEPFAKAIHETMDLKTIDAVADVLEKMENVNCEAKMEYQSESQWFFGTYKYADVEFKE